MIPIKRAILLVAGYGSRLWPITKIIPKSLLNIVNYPVIHYTIKEIAESGIEDLTIVTGPDRANILFQEYIDHELKSLYGLKFTLKTQKIPMGMVDAIKHGIGTHIPKPTAIIVGDDLLITKPWTLKNLIEAYNKIRKPIFSLLKIRKEEACKYGMVKISKKIGDIYEIENLIEKPKNPKDIPSDLSIYGRYILTEEIFEIIKKMNTSKDEEIFLPDIFKVYLKNGGKLYGSCTKGIRFDTGSKIGLLKAQVYFGLQDKDTKKEFKQFLNNL